MKKMLALAIGALGVVPFGESAVAAQAPSPGAAPHAQEYRHYEGPPVTLEGLLEEAAAKNPDLLALRKQIEVARQRPAQERSLNPPMAEAEIWQWPINTLNPANTNMYMFMVGQDLPGRGKRALRAAVAEKDIELAEIDVTIRARQIVNDIKQAYASLYIARKAIDVHLANVDLLRQIADVAQAKYTTGRISQQDVLKPVVELSRLHTDIIRFDEQASLATARLNVFLDRAPETPIGPVVDAREEMLMPTTADLQRMAIEHQPELVRARLEIERADAELASARQEYKPDFTIQGGYLVMPNQTDSFLARVGVTWPLLRTTILPQSQQTLDVSRVAYQTDRVDFQALIDNERVLLDSQLEYFRALSDFEQATADLERAVGIELPASTTVVTAAREAK